MASSSAVKGGEAFVSLFLDDNQLKRGLDGASKDLKAFGAGLTKIGAGMIGIGAVILGPIAAGLTDLMGYAKEMRMLALRTGETVETMSAFAYAAKIAGLQTEDVAKMVKFLHKNLDGVDEEAAKGRKAIEALGLSMSDITAMGFEDQVLAIAEQFKKLKNAGQAGNLAQMIFGKSGEETLNLLKRGADGIRVLMQEGRDLGAVLTTEDATAVKEFGLSLDRLKNTGRFALMALGKALIPALGDLQELNKRVISTVRGFRLWIEKNSALIILLAKVGAGLVIGGTALVALGFAFTQLGVVITTVYGLLSGFIGLLLSPVGIILGIAAAVTYLWTQTAAGAGFIGKVGELWKSTWGNIVAAVQDGDLEGAFRIVILNLKVMWADFVSAIKQTQTDLAIEMAKILGAKKNQGGASDISAFAGTQTDEQKFGRGPNRQVNPNRGKDDGGILAQLEAMKRGQARGVIGDAADIARKALAAELKQQDLMRGARDAAKQIGIPKLQFGGKGGGAAALDIPQYTAGTYSSYALGQSLGQGDKVADKLDKVADGIDAVKDAVNGVKDAVQNQKPPVHK